jgi:hypothetical protein
MGAGRERFHCAGVPNAHLWTNSNKYWTQSNRGRTSQRIDSIETSGTRLDWILRWLAFIFLASGLLLLLVLIAFLLRVFALALRLLEIGGSDHYCLC